MEKLSCESLVKWRTASSSLTSGSRGLDLRRRFAGIACVAFAAGASGHCPAALRPGREYSKMIFSGCFCMAMCMSSSGRAHGELHRFAQCIGVRLDVGGRAGLGGADEQRIAKLRIVG